MVAASQSVARHSCQRLVVRSARNLSLSGFNGNEVGRCGGWDVEEGDEVRESGREWRTHRRKCARQDAKRKYSSQGGGK